MTLAVVAARERRCGNEEARHELRGLRHRLNALWSAASVEATDGSAGRVQLKPLVEERLAALLKGRSEIRAKLHGVDFLLPAVSASHVNLIVTEALINAVQHAFADRSGRIEVAFSAEQDGSAEIVVRDNGNGQAHLPPKSGADDAPCGLAIAGELAQRLGGRIEVSGRPGEGSQFVLHLPPGSTQQS